MTRNPDGLDILRFIQEYADKKKGNKCKHDVERELTEDQTNINDEENE